ncbi:Uu.00g100730.m01.CDS01 [Anthostomella pinea]|uniref:Uu.00g100730.m01.CDS01 n=1 Tax=Anthostomella pinea TaxID=933095 RepID=A0AAI8VD47_9PEZI|nr:Uu.00g100730.m01.CDS01 [Anthostomella pinea]
MPDKLPFLWKLRPGLLPKPPPVSVHPAPRRLQRPPPPFSAHPAPPQSRREAWTSAEILPHVDKSERRVCYPRLEPWSSNWDGQRRAHGKASPSLKALATLEQDPRSQAIEAALGTNTHYSDWDISIEGSMRRLAGPATASVPTVMLVKYDGSDSDEYDPAYLEGPWPDCCESVVELARDAGAAYFAVEVVHYGKLRHGRQRRGGQGVMGLLEDWDP